MEIKRVSNDIVSGFTTKETEVPKEEQKKTTLGVGSAVSSFENNTRMHGDLSKFLSSNSNSLGNAELKLEKTLSRDEENIASNIGVDKTPEDNNETTNVDQRRSEITNSASDATSAPDARLADTRKGLQDYLNASGQDSSHLDELSQKILSGEFTLPTDQERRDGILENAGLSGADFNSRIRTDVLADAKNVDNGSNLKGKEGVSIGEAYRGVETTVYKTPSDQAEKTGILEYVKQGENYIVNVKMDSNTNTDSATIYRTNGTKIEITREYKGNSGDYTETATTTTKNNTSTTTTTKEGNKTTTTTTITTKNSDGTTTTTTEKKETKTETTSPKTPTDPDQAGATPEVRKIIEDLRTSLREAGPKRGSGDIDPTEDAPPNGAPVDANSFLQKQKLMGVAQPPDELSSYGGHPIGSSPNSGGDIDHGPDSTETGYSGAPRGGDPGDLDVTVGGTKIKSTDKSSKEEEEEDHPKKTTFKMPFVFRA